MKSAPEKLKQTRRKFNLTQERIGNMLGVPGNTIAVWEREEQAITHPTMLIRALRDIDNEMKKKKR